MNINKPEVLSPAGNLEKLRFAVNYGADAVYCALTDFGMRAASENFTPEEFAEGLKYAHSKNARVYLTLNTMPSETKLRQLPDVLHSIKDCCPDAFIVSDPGVMAVIKSVFPDAVLHLSTQASTVNAEACKFWYKNGVSRIVLARELTLEDIKEIRKNIPNELELEAFVHGAMCISYSGRCLLSNHFSSRNANEGRCAQPCRWKYYFYEEKRENDILTAEQNPEGTYVFSSKDLCMLEHIGDVLDAGITSLKIEGRMKSAYYTACVTNAYKIAIEDYFAGRPFNTQLLKEVEGVSHREYNTGFYYASPSENANTVTIPGYICDKPVYCYITDYNEETQTALCFQKNKMYSFSEAQILSPNSTGRDIEIGQIYDSDMNPIESAPHPQMLFYVKVPNAKVGDIIRSK